MVTNGYAEAYTHPHPIMLHANPEAYVSIGIENNGNKYFKVRRITSTDELRMC